MACIDLIKLYVWSWLGSNQLRAERIILSCNSNDLSKLWLRTPEKRNNREWNMWNVRTRWFNTYVTFSSPIWRSPTTFELGSHFHTPKKDTKNCQEEFSFQLLTCTWKLFAFGFLDKSQNCSMSYLWGTSTATLRGAVDCASCDSVYSSYVCSTSVGIQQLFFQVLPLIVNNRVILIAIVLAIRIQYS